MSIKIGNKIVSDSIVFNLDFANRKCFAPNILNYSSWTVGTGTVNNDATKYGVTNFAANGQVGEDVRVTGVDPFGYTSSVVWKSSTVDTTTPTGDGGWNSGNFSIDNSKIYRFSVWTKRDAMTVGPTSSGAFYLGHYARPTAGGVTFSKALVNGALTANPYHHITPNTNTSATSSVFSPYLGGLDVWTLVVGHVWSAGTAVQPIVPGSSVNGLAANGSHPDSGVWTRVANKIGNPYSGQDYIWYEPTTFANHRAYLFYSADLTATQSFIYPRVDIVDGLEPSIHELLAGPEPVKDMSSKMNVIYPFSTTNFDKNERGVVFSGIEREVIGGTLSSTFSVFSLSTWFKPSTQINSTTPGQTLVQFGSPAITQPFVIFLGATTVNLTDEVITIWGSGKYTSVVSPVVLDAVWQNLTIVWQGSSYNVYLNGVLQSTVAGSTGHATPNLNVNYTALGGRKYAALGVEWDAFFQGIIGSVVVYEKSLTESEVISNYSSMIRKYG